MTVTIAIPKETKVGELRVAMTPSLLPRLSQLGVKVKLQHAAGAGIHAADQLYQGVSIAQSWAELYQHSEIVLKVQPPTSAELEAMPDHAVLISFLYPKLHRELLDILLKKKITSLAMELIPRSSRAQDMDALSSQATIIGYKAVLLAADHSKFFFPMLTTAAGSIRPANVFVIGVGVAGLQAIATAKRLGAQVSAYDVRPETKEQTESLGAKFLDLGVDAVGTGGYARALTAEEQQQQNDLLQQHIASCDVIITTAGVPGSAAPKLLSQGMVELMKPGSVIVDAMAEMGGNCTLTKPGETVSHNNVTILGPINIPSMLAINASEMYARNLVNLLNIMVKEQQLNIDWQDEIIAGTAVTHNGAIVNEQVKNLLGDL